MKLFLEMVLIAGVIGWAAGKFYFEVDYGLAKAITLLALICYAPVLVSHLSKTGKETQ
jgi:hypothetical protein